MVDCFKVNAVKGLELYYTSYKSDFYTLPEQVNLFNILKRLSVLISLG